MTTNIKLRRSAVTGNIPTTAQLDLGEVAINTFDGIIFIKKDDGAESIVSFPQVTTSLINSLNVNADTLDSQDGSYYLDYNNFTNTPTSGGIVWSTKTANHTALNNEGIIADTSGGTFTITLPASPATGTNVILADGGDWSVANLTVGRNGSTIEGAAEDLTLDIGSIQVHLVYSGTTWEVYAFTGPKPNIEEDDTTTNATKYITWSDGVTGAYDAKVSSTKLFFNPSSGLLTSTDYNSLSDRRLKENINDIEVNYEMLDRIRSVSFDWKDSGKSAYGFIAQELEEIMPELVNENEETTYKSVSYTQLIPHLLEAIKDLKREVDELKEKK